MLTFDPETLRKALDRNIMTDGNSPLKATVLDILPGVVVKKSWSRGSFDAVCNGQIISRSNNGPWMAWQDVAQQILDGKLDNF